jgi:hypothetical protein
MTERSRNGASSERSETEGTDRRVEDTERTPEEWGETIGHWIARTAGRAREEAEDIWAEAQALRRKLG